MAPPSDDPFEADPFESDAQSTVAIPPGAGSGSDTLVMRGGAPVDCIGSGAVEGGHSGDLGHSGDVARSGDLRRTDDLEEAVEDDGRKKRKDPLLADFVLEMTKSMCRTGYYSKSHPEAVKALSGMYESFMSLMEERGRELTFQLSFSREGDDEDVALYDGRNPLVLMRDVLTTGAANNFVPKLVEYFHRQGLLSLSIARELLAEHFEIFIERMTRIPDPTAQRRGEMLSRDLAAAGVRGVSVVFAEDRIAGLKGSIPWRAELALTRLRKDLRMIPMLAHATDDEIRRMKSRLIEDILRGLQQVDLLVALARHLGDALEGQEQILTRSDAETGLIDALHPRVLGEICERMVLPFDDGDGETPHDRETRQRLIRMLVERLFREEPSASVTTALVAMYTHGYITLDGLPPDARELIRANALARAALESPDDLFGELGQDAPGDPVGGVIVDLELTARTLIERGEWHRASIMFDVLWQTAMGQLPVAEGTAERAHGALAELGARPDLRAAVAAAIGNERKPKAREGALSVLRRFDAESGIETLLVVLDGAESPTLRLWAVDEIGRRAWDAPHLVLQAVSNPTAKWYVVRGLLAVLRRIGDESAYSTVAQLYEHERPQVRSEALMTMAQLSPDRASRIIERALDEKEPELRRAAALAAAATPKANEAVVQRMANILRDDREREGIRLQVAASLTAILTRERESPMRESVLEVFRGVIGDKYGTRMHRFRRFVESRLPPPSHLLAAVCAGLGAIGDPDDQRLLMACMEDESPDVQEAARLAIGKLRAAERGSQS